MSNKMRCWYSLLLWLLCAPLAFASNQLNSIDVTSNDDSVTRMTFKFDDNSMLMNFDKKAQVLVVTLQDTTVRDVLIGNKKLNHRAGLLKSLAVKADDGDIEITMTSSSAFGYDYYQSNNQLTVELFPLASAPKKKSSVNSNRTNSTISINFQEIPIRSVLQMLAEHNGFNLVVSDTVNGSLTLRLDEVPWQTALDTILKIKGLDKRQIGNILLVAPKIELDEQERLLLEVRRQEEELASLRSEVIKINYADAHELQMMFDGEDDDSISLLSERGSIGVDLRTNSLVIKDISENIEIIKSMLISLDIPVEQVEIEARIVTVEEGTLDEIGVRWGIANRNGDFSVGGSIEGNLGWEGDLDYDGESGDIDGTAGSGTGAGNGSITNKVDDFLNVNLGATSPNAGRIAFQVANLGKNLLIDLELSALQTEKRAEIISSPRLLTTNKRPAYIEQGTELPYLEASSSGATAVSFKKAVLSLSVTPQITNDGNLVLDIEVTQDKPAVSVKAGTGEAMSISTQRIATQVLVSDSETIVLGGIYQHEVTEGEDKIPLLGDIPYLGQLFRRNYETVAKRELLIFVTPRIIQQ